MKTFIEIEDNSGDVYNVNVDKVSHFKKTGSYGGGVSRDKHKLVLDDGTQILLTDQKEVVKLMTKISTISSGTGCGV
jgi:hypothetical protein